VSSELGYISYMLRLWQTRSGGRLVWRASLESPHTGVRKSFASLDEMFEFLWGKVGAGKVCESTSQRGSADKGDEDSEEEHYAPI
jgi:hypothetical protein